MRLSGEKEKEVVLETDPNLLAAYGLTVNELVAKIENYNRNVSGGFIEELGRKYVIKGIGILNEPKDLEELVVGYTNRQNSETNASTANPTSTSTNLSQTTDNQTSNSNEVPVLLREVATHQNCGQGIKQHCSGQPATKFRVVYLQGNKVQYCQCSQRIGGSFG